MKGIVKAAIVLLGAVWVSPSANAAFTAYNDFYQRSGDATVNITTNSFSGPTSGGLIDNGSGAASGVTITCSPAGVAGFGDFGNPAASPPGSDAYVIFNGKLGLTNYVFQNTGSSNIGPYTIQLTGLDPNSSYSFALFGSRGFDSSQYSNRMMSLTVSDADLFTNACSTGITRFTRTTANDSGEMMAANVSGMVWRFNGLKSGSDGDLQFDLYAYGTNGQLATLYMGGFMLQGFDGTSTNGGGGSASSGEDTTRYFKGTQEASSPVSNWRNRVFTNAAGWTAGSQPFGYGDTVTYGTQLNDMNGVYQSVFVRIPFVVTSVTAVASIDLSVDFDDGFMGWINGTQVANSNEPASIVYNIGGMASHESFISGGVNPVYTANLTGVGSLVTGTNILAIQGWNTALSNSDFYLGVNVTVNYSSGGGSGTNGGGGYAPTASTVPPVEINEWMPHNRSFIQNNNGHYSSWVELFNNSSSNINLTGWRLSDDISNSNKWTLPSTTMNAGSYMLIWMDSESGGSNPHATFDLATSGGTLALFQSQGQLEDAIVYEAQNSNTSGGRRPNGTLCDTTYPTPGSASTIFQVTNMVNNGATMTLRWGVEAHQSYKVQYADSFTNQTWQDLGGLVVPTTNSFSTNVPSTTASRVYRLRWVAPSRRFITSPEVDANVRSTLTGGNNLVRSASLSSSTTKAGVPDMEGLRDGVATWDNSSDGWSSSLFNGGRVRATWGSPVTLDRVWLFGLGSINTSVQKGRVWFSDGSVFDFGPLPDRWQVGPGLELSFPARSVSWFEVEIVSGRSKDSTGNGAGLAEIAAFNGAPAGITTGTWNRVLAWTNSAPAGCTFAQSTSLTGLVFTGRHVEYEGADTWYPTWASDDCMYSCYDDGFTEGVGVQCYKTSDMQGMPNTGAAKIKGTDPLDLEISAVSVHDGDSYSYEARYAAAQLVYNGIWYYGTYVCNSNTMNYTDGNGLGHQLNWPYCGTFCGFRTSTDYGKTWTDSAPFPRGVGNIQGLFDEPTSYNGPVKFGTPHFVDFGKNMQYSPDGKAYMIAHGTMSQGQTNREAGNISWITGDGIFMCRVTPTVGNINDATKYEFFAGYSGTNATWSSSLSAAQPIAWWDNHMGCVTVTYDAPLKKYLMWVTDGRWTCEEMDSYVLESDTVFGPWKRVAYLKDFGPQGYFLNTPSKFISKDGKTLWLSYSANFRIYNDGGSNNWDTRFNNALDNNYTEGGRYAFCLAEIKLLP